jgi:hypothetical protein
VVSLLTAAAGCVFSAEADAAPSCPEQTLRTPYMTPVTTTLACTDSLHPIVRYLPLGYPSATFTVVGDQATINPGPLIGNTEHVFSYYADNAIFERTMGFLKVQIGPAPTPPPPPNHAPLARCDSYSVKPGETLDIRRPGVLSNDSDPDGDLLRVEFPYTHVDFPTPGVSWNGAVRWIVPSRPGLYSYRYLAADSQGLQSETTLTIWVGTEDKGCRPASDPPPFGERRFTNTLLRASGAVRIRTGGRWRSLGARHRLTRPLLVDARRGSVRVRRIDEDNYEREVISGRFAGGVFKLGTSVRLPNGKLIPTGFGGIKLAGALGCRGGSGRGRRLEVAATPTFTIEALRLRAANLSIRNRRTLSRFTVSDRCNGTSVVESRAGRVHVRDNTRGASILTGRRTYVAKPRRN